MITRGESCGNQGNTEMLIVAIEEEKEREIS